eukprot:15138478-Alexandrium_andersonii.AAC.1
MPCQRMPQAAVSSQQWMQPPTQVPAQQTAASASAAEHMASQATGFFLDSARGVVSGVLSVARSSLGAA